MNISAGYRQTPSEWSSGLFSCGALDCETCCLTYWLPCITFGKTAEILDEGEFKCFCHGFWYGCLMMMDLHWLYAFFYRKKLRQKYGLPEEPCWDCCVHFCCATCALCQEYAELKARGMELEHSKGWIVPPATSAPFPPSMSK